MTNEYIRQADDFLKNANATCEIDFVGLAVNKIWNENVKRRLYQVTLRTPKGSMLFDFWDSIHNTNKSLKSNRGFKPTSYDILACLTKYDPGTFADFCVDFGYDEDSRKALEIYFAVQKEYSELCRIFTPKQIEALREIN